MFQIEISDEEKLLPNDPRFYLDRLEAMAAELKIEGTVGLKLGGKEESQDLNNRYRQKDYPTDVLSFPFEEELPEGGYYLGDIFVCFPVAVEQAAENGIPVEQELFTLMVHGLLHLGGLDHEADEGEMLKLQEKMLEKYKDPIEKKE